ncbi:arginine/lysine/ornithine decarboxylase [Paenibacillus anaericanus]|uniref:aminotransferase class I/II-fold pyridoxal phosphate-dependent enzyme n=1 Tax=Paenibacillus anaericanus TaxID=170367 RepID=UPI002782444F|nr:aminotransferase class I/II-fold pyridoxal phosphate-dependent enzyme [Paenibacillus anaericanus]MDQ0091724.1 arginine/lysine/ornithine decarboxylase [Paenibacillus anaericanus]
MLDSKESAPLYEALLRYKKSEDVSFHVPGHKDGQAYRSLQMGGEPLTQVMDIDITEITGSDDLHHPEGVILEAQQRATSYFGADQTFFLVGGSTAGNLALILSVCTTPGDVLLVQRNVHKSVIHGLMLANANAVFLAPQIHAKSGLATIPAQDTVREALRRHPNAKGVLVTHPNYYGMGTSLKPLAELCHNSGVPLLVDEAHGAHFGLHPKLPENALEAGADGVVQSTHKMLTALTMGAMLHVQGDLLDRRLLAQRLAMIQSSSPSYPIMASLDLSRSLLQTKGQVIFEEGLAAAQTIRNGIANLSRFDVLKVNASGTNAAYDIQDPFKVVLYDASGQWSGYELQEKLEAAGCIPEMSDDRYVVLALSQGTTYKDTVRLLLTLENMDKDEYIRESTRFSTWNIAQEDEVSSPILFSLTPISEEMTEAVSIEQSVGRQAAEMIIPYPPGIPLLYPGEMISKETMVRLVGLREAKAKCQGAEDPLLRAIRVRKVKEGSRGKV